jgi:chitin disaccharide deacetylase
MNMRMVGTAVAALSFGFATVAQDMTYAERLGWPKGSKVVMFHSDDMGMSYETNVGTEKSFKEGVVTSVSTMMPTPWVPHWNQILKDNPGIDNGLHLTLTSEWDDYRWGPVAGKPAVPSLVDEQGCLWDNVPLVVQHATADDVEREIRAQIDRAETMGMPITHLDSHMGTLFATPEFFERYVKVGIEKNIPILIASPNGHLMNRFESGAAEVLAGTNLHEKVWDAGLPVLDDVTGQSYGWKTFDEKKKMFVEILKDLRPGVTELIVHCTLVGEHFAHISSSGNTRQADLDVCVDEDIKRIIKEEGIILTTWRELKERRDALDE